MAYNPATLFSIISSPVWIPLLESIFEAKNRQFVLYVDIFNMTSGRHFVKCSIYVKHTLNKFSRGHIAAGR